VFYTKFIWPVQSPTHKIVRVFVDSFEFVHKWFCIPLGTNALFIQHRENPHAPLKKLEHSRVFNVAHIKGVYSFMFILFFDRKEIVNYISVLKTFVGIVNAQLLKTIHLKWFKPKKIKHTNGRIFAIQESVIALLRWGRECIYALNNQLEHLSINFFGECITAILWLNSCQLRLNQYTSGCQYTSRDGLLYHTRFDAH